MRKQTYLAERCLMDRKASKRIGSKLLQLGAQVNPKGKYEFMDSSDFEKALDYLSGRKIPFGYNDEWLTITLNESQDEESLQEKLVKDISVIDTDHYVVGKKGMWFAKDKSESDLLTKAYWSADEGKTWHHCYLEKKSAAPSGRTQTNKAFFRSPKTEKGRVSIGRNILTWYANKGPHEVDYTLEVDHVNGDYTDDHLSNLEPVTSSENKKRRKAQSIKESKDKDLLATGNREVEYGINWTWFYTDTEEDAIKWFKQLMGVTPNKDTLVGPVEREHPGKHDDTWSFRLRNELVAQLEPKLTEVLREEASVERVDPSTYKVRNYTVWTGSEKTTTKEAMKKMVDLVERSYRSALKNYWGETPPAKQMLLDNPFNRIRWIRDEEYGDMQRDEELIRFTKDLRARFNFLRNEAAKCTTWDSAQKQWVKDKIQEGMFDEDSRYELIKSKSVEDSDGFLTDYTMYQDTKTGSYLFIFGDKDFYGPEDTDPDWECDTLEEAEEWWDSYESPYTESLQEDILDPFYDDETRKGTIPAPEEEKKESLHEDLHNKLFVDTLEGSWKYGNKVEPYKAFLVVAKDAVRYGSTLSNASIHCHDEAGHEIKKFDSQEEAQVWIDKYGQDCEFEVLRGDELHAYPKGAEHLYEDYEALMERASPDGYAPKKSGKAYKVFRVRNGKLYPPMVANAGGEATPVGVWLDAEEGEFAGLSKTGRPQVKSTGSGTLAYRPGWHLGDVPRAPQFDRRNKETGEMEFPKDFVWAECDYAMDVDYQPEADEQGYLRTKVDANGNVITTKSDKYQHSLAGLKKLPKDGYYKYRTNPNPDTVPWVITGQMRVNRLLSDAEVNEILKSRGIAPIHRQGGDKTLAELGLKESLSIKEDLSDKCIVREVAIAGTAKEAQKDFQEQGYKVKVKPAGKFDQYALVDIIGSREDLEGLSGDGDLFEIEEIESLCKTIESPLKEGVKFKKVWMLGGDQKHPELDDYIEKYVSERGTEIECGHDFNNWSTRWYQVGDKNFETLADAKAYVAQLEGRSLVESVESDMDYLMRKYAELYWMMADAQGSREKAVEYQDYEDASHWDKVSRKMDQKMFEIVNDAKALDPEGNYNIQYDGDGVNFVTKKPYKGNPYLAWDGAKKAGIKTDYRYNSDRYFDKFQYKKPLIEKIVKKGNKYQVQSEKGRNMGTYDTKGEAEERLKQIEKFKHINAVK